MIWVKVNLTMMEWLGEHYGEIVFVLCAGWCFFRVDRFFNDVHKYVEYETTYDETHDDGEAQ